MKWLLVSKPSNSLHLFNLMQENTVMEILSYNPSQQSVRFSCDGRQRLFFIEPSGFRNNHAIFINEYGLTVGKFSFDKWHSDAGHIEIEGKKFHFSIEHYADSELVITGDDGTNPTLRCSLSILAADAGRVYFNLKETLNEYACLLLGLCWYLNQPSAKEISPGQKTDLKYA